MREQGDKDNALPFMTFYDVLCPLVPENEKGQKRAERSEKVETEKQRERADRERMS